MVNEGFEYRERIGPQAEGRSVLSYLSDRYTHSSPEQWRGRIDSGQVLLDSERVRPDTLMRRGQTLLWRRPPWNEPEIGSSFAVLFEDEILLAVDKPAGLPTLPGASFLNSTLLCQVRRHAPDASPLHRLGRWTSGVVLFSRNREARAQLTRQWPDVRKRYRALAEGDPLWSETTVRVPIGPVTHHGLGHVHAASATGRASSTRFAVRERRGGAFLCDAFLATGRPHQIRIHLAAAGHPLAGDPLYVRGGVPSQQTRALPGDPGYLLHAQEISFRHPRTGRSVTVECEPPPPLRSL